MDILKENGYTNVRNAGGLVGLVSAGEKISMGKNPHMQEADKNYCTLYLARHGETEWNVARTVIGQKDSPLTEKGILQAEETAETLRNVKFDAIFSSRPSPRKADGRNHKIGEESCDTDVAIAPRAIVGTF